MDATPNKIFLGAGEDGAWLDLRYANRHGLITGATGTGKTVTVQSLIEAFSRHGVAVVVGDVKGDLSGIAAAGSHHPGVEKRVAQLALRDFHYSANPAVFWDVFAEKGHALRTTVSDMGPWLLGRALELSDAQEGVLHIVFKFADDEGLLLLDLKDLKAALDHVADNGAALRSKYGNVSAASAGAIQRRLLMFAEQGGERFLGEPALDVADVMRVALQGEGIVNVIAADQLLLRPQLYAMVHLWLLAELFEQLPEVGDADKPRLVVFLDEAHVMFRNATKFMLEQVEQVVRLIRSKGVGLFFITQHPNDIPDGVLRQLGNRVHHGMRAYTPQDQKAIRALVQGLPITPGLDAEKELTNLGVGEALVSLLNDKGAPGPVQHVAIRPPGSRIGPLTDQERVEIMSRSPLKGVYDKVIDRHSAYERLMERLPASPAVGAAGRPEKTSRREEPLAAFGKSLLRSVGSALGRQLIRGVMGALKRG